MWQEIDNSLRRDFTFTDFKAAFFFMTRVAEIAERLNHHPSWSNEYNRVSISLSTHSAGNTVTEKDRELAAAIDSVLEG